MLPRDFPWFLLLSLTCSQKGESRRVKIKKSLLILNGLLNAKDTIRNIKGNLCTAPVCQGSNFSKNFIVQPDVSETKLSAIQCQETDGKEHLGPYITEKSFRRG